MTVSEKAAALLEAIGAADLQRMSRAERQRLSNACERVDLLIGKVERESVAPKAGVLADLLTRQRNGGSHA
jgi:hypothetical protein